MRRVLVVLAVVSASVAACGGSGDGDGGASEAPPPLVYVAVGASDSVGVGADDPATQAWPVVFRERALPETATFTNVAVSGAKTEDALRDQVPRAVALEPDLVTVWLNVNDLRAFVSPEEYGARLTQIVERLRRGGLTTVLVANTPELDSLPALTTGPLAGASALVDSQVDKYNERIAAVAGAEGAVLVDLNGPSARAEADGTFPSLVSADGFHPNAAGYAVVADAFAGAFARTDLAP